MTETVADSHFPHEKENMTFRISRRHLLDKLDHRICEITGKGWGKREEREMEGIVPEGAENERTVGERQ